MKNLVNLNYKDVVDRILDLPLETYWNLLHRMHINSISTLYKVIEQMTTRELNQLYKKVNSYETEGKINRTNDI